MTPAAAAVVAQASSMTGPEAAFVSLVDRALADPALLVFAVAAAFGVGAVHALAPGHGKAIAAAYLVGGRGRTRDALLLGATVAAMHTVSVVALALGLAVVLRNSGATPESATQVTPALRVVSGLIVVGLGSWLVWTQLHRRGHGHEHDHSHGPGDTGVEPSGESEAEVPRPFSRRGLVALGLSGGLLPSPSAFLVLVTTSLTGRLLLGLLLVVVFSLGLAATLTVIGVAVVRGREALVDRLGTARQRRLLRSAAVAGAVLVLAGGVVMTAAGILAL